MEYSTATKNDILEEYNKNVYYTESKLQDHNMQCDLILNKKKYDYIIREEEVIPYSLSLGGSVMVGLYFIIFAYLHFLNPLH